MRGQELLILLLMIVDIAAGLAALMAGVVLFLGLRVRAAGRLVTDVFRGRSRLCGARKHVLDIRGGGGSNEGSQTLSFLSLAVALRRHSETERDRIKEISLNSL